jgi:thermostable 8-oxoguanine DNA glycosylase
MNDYKYFEDNLSDLFKKFGHRFIVIKNESVIGDYDTFDAAYENTVKTEELGTFIIQECVDDPEKLIKHFQSNIVFAPAEAVA